MTDMVKIKIWPQDLWPKGPWNEEYDFYFWEEGEYSFTVIRNPAIGTLNGYIGIPESNKYYNDQILCSKNLECHGGVTFSNKKDDLSFEICLGKDKIKELSSKWWIGFDCAHCWDAWPTNEIFSSLPETTYKDFNYVKKELESLHEQIKENNNERSN